MEPGATWNHGTGMEAQATKQPGRVEGNGDKTPWNHWLRCSVGSFLGPLEPGAGCRPRHRRAGLCKHNLIRDFCEGKPLGIGAGSDVCRQQISPPRLVEAGMRLGWSLRPGSWCCPCCGRGRWEKAPPFLQQEKQKMAKKNQNIRSLNQWQQTPASNNLRNCKDFFFLPSLMFICGIWLSVWNLLWLALPFATLVACFKLLVFSRVF